MLVGKTENTKVRQKMFIQFKSLPLTKEQVIQCCN